MGTSPEVEYVRNTATDPIFQTTTSQLYSESHLFTSVSSITLI
jgi:hypothetical protein